ncbi:LPP20 family lipoprotein [Sulfurimonas sp.]|uniref:LPP20 family lipoprotein n=1 Tax=Sulfurimonas sp. TaxID=2022749 RepID=UPI003561E882
MKYSLLLATLLSASALVAGTPQEINSLETQISSVEEKLASMESDMADMKATKKSAEQEEQVLKENSNVLISVTGQGVAPMNTTSPAQAYALAKRAATADAYRLIAEKVKGVRIDGQDLIKNMMVKRSTIRTSVKAMIRNSNIVETTFKEGLCEVEMEIVLSHAQFAQ